MFNIRKLLASRKGYTIDQTILIVAIIAILITLIIVTVGWQLINRTSGTKLGSQLKQMSDATSQFYGANHVFPHQAFATAPTTPALGNVVVLSGLLPTGAAWLSSIQPGNITNLLGGFKATAGQVNDSFGGPISMMNGTVNTWTGSAATNEYLIFQFENVPLTDAQEADRSIDGVINSQTGRVVYATAACLPAAGAAVTAPAAVAAGTSSVYVCYVADAIN